MLISRKLAKYKRCVSDFRHKNIRIAKTRFGLSFHKEIDLKSAFHSLRLTKELKTYCRILPYFDSTSFLYLDPLSDISQAIWQSYINTILDCLQSRKYCKAIMVDCYYLHQTKNLASWKIF